jgi:hypothetical protein
MVSFVVSILFQMFFCKIGFMNSKIFSLYVAYDIVVDVMLVVITILEIYKK